MVWVVNYARREDLRTILIRTSVPLGLVGLALNVLYVRDWWCPQTLTGTIPAIEDFLYGFGMGTAAVLPHVVLRTTPTFRFEPLQQPRCRSVAYVYIFVGGVALYYAMHLVLGLHNIVVSLLILAIGTCVVLVRRRDLVGQALVAGAAFSLLSSLIYVGVTAISPGWIDAFWYFDLLPRTIFLGLPLEDVLFYFLFGTFIGTHYHAWYGARSVKYHPRAARQLATANDALPAGERS